MLWSRLITPAAMLLAATLLLPGVARAGDGVRIATVRPVGSGLPLSVVAPDRFQLVGVHWSGDAQLELRAVRSDGRFTGWVRLSPESPVWTGDAVRVQLRRTTAGSATGLRVSFITSPPGQLRAGVTPRSIDRPAIVTRSAWGADESLRHGGPWYAEALKMVFVHHTATASSYSCADSARIVRGIYAYHVLSNGWSDIGYNFLIDRCGQVFEGRYGGVTRPVIGAHVLGFNTASAGIAMIGNFTYAAPTSAAMTALKRLVAWRLDVAHVDPTSHALMTASGNDRYRAGAKVWLRVVSGHRDGNPSACPGSALYPLLPGVARAARAIGLPKIWNPRAQPIHRLGPGQTDPIRFQARFSHRTLWTLRVIGPDGPVVTRSGTGDALDWTWNGLHELLPAGSYRWTLHAADARSVVLPLGTLGPWLRPAPAVAVAGAITAGDVTSLLLIDGNVLSAVGFETVNHLAVTEAQFNAAAEVGASIASPVGGGHVTIELWDYGAAAWVGLGSCTLSAATTCRLTRDASGGSFGRWDAGAEVVELRVRYTADAELAADLARALAIGG